MMQCPRKESSSASGRRLLLSVLSIAINHFFAHVTPVAKRCVSARFAVCASPSAGATIPHRVVGACAGSWIALDGLLYQGTRNLIIRLSLLRRCSERAKQQAHCGHHQHFHDFPSETFSIPMMHPVSSGAIGVFAGGEESCRPLSTGPVHKPMENPMTDRLRQEPTRAIGGLIKERAE
jgi:hypothetical protein